MSSEDAGIETIDWYVEAQDPHASSAAGARALRSRAQRLHDERANSLGVIIITTLFFVLFAAAVVVGGRAAVAPMLRAAMAARESGSSTSDILLAMPDGMFCRHMSYNNATGNVTEAGLEQCPSYIERGGPTTPSRFEWGSQR